MKVIGVVGWASLMVGLAQPAVAGPDRDAEHFVEAVEKINRKHVDDGGNEAEEELAEKLPKSAVKALEKLLKAKDSSETIEALKSCGEAALDLALIEEFGEIRSRLLEIDPDAAAEMGGAVARERILVRGIGGFQEGYLDEFADVADAILDAYDEVFGFKEWSKVPGKKVRIRVHLVDRITRPPHFAPQFPYHSEIDMPVIDPVKFRSPTAKGKMMFYGLCHEFGHLISMWGDRRHMEDHHAWAHYTGVVIVGHMAQEKKFGKVTEGLKDVRWRSLKLEREKKENRIGPSTSNRAGVMAMLIGLHDAAGPESIGKALNLMNEESMGHRINHVRYYGFSDLEKALGQVLEGDARLGAAKEIFAELDQ